jgi:hypothetical protein
LGVVSFKAGSTSGVLMFPGYVGCQTTTPPPYYVTTGSYTTKAQECYTTIHDAPSCNTESRSITLRVDGYAVSHYALKYYSAPSYYTTKGTETLDYACCPILPHPRLLRITLFLSTYWTYFQVLICSQLLHRGFADYSTKTVEYYTEAAKYYSAPIYTTTTEAAKYYAVPTCYTEAALSCYVELKHYTGAPVYYTTIYARPNYNTTAPKYYTEKAAYYATTYAAWYTTSGILSIPLLQTTTKLKFIRIITPAILPTKSPLLTLLRPIHRSYEVFLWMCRKIAEIQDWSINHKCMSLFSPQVSFLLPIIGSI